MPCFGGFEEPFDLLQDGVGGQSGRLVDQQNAVKISSATSSGSRAHSANSSAESAAGPPSGAEALLLSVLASMS